MRNPFRLFGFALAIVMIVAGIADAAPRQRGRNNTQVNINNFGAQPAAVIAPAPQKVIVQPQPIIVQQPAPLVVQQPLVLPTRVCR